MKNINQFKIDIKCTDKQVQINRAIEAWLKYLSDHPFSYTTKTDMQSKK